MLVLAGKNNISVDALNLIQKKYDGDVAVVCNRTDDGVHGWQRSLRKEALDRGVRILSLDEAYVEASIFISLEFDRIVNPAKFRTDSIYNIHFSLLPQYKGMYTSVWPILNNEEKTGVTLHRIDPGVDTGDIIDQIEITIEESDRARDLYRKYLKYGYVLFEKQFCHLLSGETNSILQKSSLSSYNSKSSLDFSNLCIDLNKTAFEIKKQIYAFSFREYQMPSVFGRNISEVEILGSRSFLKPATVLCTTEKYFDVATIDYDIRLYFDCLDNIDRFSDCARGDLEALLSGLAGVHDRNHKGWSPIIVAAYHGNIDAVNYLLQKGADPNDVNINGTSVLMYAKEFCLSSGDKTIFEILLDNGASLDCKDYSGRQLVDYLNSVEIDFFGL